MRVKIIQIYLKLKGSYWFLPLLLSVGAILLAIATLYIDREYGDLVNEVLLRRFSTESSGARAILSTLAGSLITVAGVCFSMTIVSVSFSSSHFGPRLISNVMRDRGNQLTLGVFVSTFIYSLLILRSIREKYTDHNGNSYDLFVPQFSILCALSLGLLSIVVLIYFFHHIPESLNISNIVAKTGSDLISNIKKYYKLESDQYTYSDAEIKTYISKNSLHTLEVRSKSYGYIQTLDQLSLLTESVKKNVIVELHTEPGDFICAEQLLLTLHARSPIPPNFEESFSKSFGYGKERSLEQDILFQVDLMLELIARALSPGINDPYTAVTCVNWLRGALLMASNREVEEYLCRKDDIIRVVAKALSFELISKRIFQGSRQYISKDRTVTYSLLQNALLILESVNPTEKKCMVSLALELCDEALIDNSLDQDRDEILIWREKFVTAV